MNIRFTALFTAVLLSLAISASAQQQQVVARTYDPSGRFIGFASFALPTSEVQTEYVHDTVTEMSGVYGGGKYHTLGNTTISGTLTVTGATYLNNAVNVNGALNASYDAPAASTTITIVKDITVISDAGGIVTIVLPPAPPTGESRVLHIKNASTTYSATDGANVTIAPNSHVDLTWYGSGWE